MYHKPFSFSAPTIHTKELVWPPSLKLCYIVCQFLLLIPAHLLKCQERTLMSSWFHYTQTKTKPSTSLSLTYIAFPLYIILLSLHQYSFQILLIQFSLSITDISPFLTTPLNSHFSLPRAQVQNNTDMPSSAYLLLQKHQSSRLALASRVSHIPVNLTTRLCHTPLSFAKSGLRAISQSHPQYRPAVKNSELSVSEAFTFYPDSCAHFGLKTTGPPAQITLSMHSHMQYFTEL